MCVVTGAASGLGYELVRQLLSYDAQVCLADIDSEGLEEAKLNLSEFTKNLTTVQFDAANKTTIDQLVNFVQLKFGSIDFIFNNAGIGGSLPIEQATTEHWKRIIDLNLWSVINCTESVLPIMLKQGSGHIVNTSSISGLIPVPGQALYNTTKYAIVGFSESLRIELAPKGIDVTVICPGPFVSKIWGKPILGESVDISSPTHAVSAEDVAKDALESVARKRGIVVIPLAEKRNWRAYRWIPTLVEKSLSKLVRK
ncbi:hypothetical protein AUQ44_01245 [Vibrio cidicii]|uniref:Short-chain dehydrogenase n=1 Tax=Vibrio cidicii TaxID=1763883 RepID=A0A151JL47_9VIBR|nr:hypothetical protein AUQ44_01245 [Vibrio cidicii]